jgi:ubiquinone/menaquinone biosynthesis C-methylase UbiE
MLPVKSNVAHPAIESDMILSERHFFMSAVDKAFTGSIPENYDRLMVPLIFDGYAVDMAERVAARVPRAVLEIAAGSGVVTRALAPKLASDATYTVTDLNQPMLDYAASRLRDDRIIWQQADAQDLPFRDASFDAVCCQFGAMFFPKREQAYAEARRVLKPGGLFIFSVWDRIEDNVFANEITNSLVELFPDDPPRFLARTPHGHHDTPQIRSELTRAGFRDIQIDTVAKQSRGASPRHPAMAYCQGTPLRNEIEARGGDLEKATDHAAKAIAKNYGDGPVTAKIQAHIIAATA